MLLQDIINQYKPLDINKDDLEDRYREGLEIVERNNIACIIKHPNQESYLISFWKNIGWSGFLTGGIEDGEDIQVTVKREVQEETGYTNIKKITELKFVSHGLFYHVNKKQNRLAHYNLVLVELSDLTQQDISQEEQNICDFIWISKQDVYNNLKRNDMKWLWEFYLQNIN